MDSAQQPSNSKLTPDQDIEMREGFLLEEMTKSPGWEILKEMLEDLAFHSWADPRAAKNMDEWAYMELNSFHAANVAKEIMESITVKIDNAQHYGKVKSGEIKPAQRMKI